MQRRQHDKPDAYLTPDHRTTQTVLELRPRYTTGRSYVAGIGYTHDPTLISLFWGPEGDSTAAQHGIVSGPGFWADGKDFPPGSRLVVTTRIDLPAADDPAP